MVYVDEELLALRQAAKSSDAAEELLRQVIDKRKAEDQVRVSGGATFEADPRVPYGWKGAAAGVFRALADEAVEALVAEVDAAVWRGVAGLEPMARFLSAEAHERRRRRQQEEESRREAAEVARRRENAPEWVKASDEYIDEERRRAYERRAVEVELERREEERRRLERERIEAERRENAEKGGRKR
jgi:hypothetical protein